MISEGRKERGCRDGDGGISKGGETNEKGFVKEAVQSNGVVIWIGWFISDVQGVDEDTEDEDFRDIGTFIFI